jgi:uncharacterized membrane protein (UPF0136 family)
VVSASLLNLLKELEMSGPRHFCIYFGLTGLLRFLCLKMPRFLDIVARILSVALGLYLSVGGTMGFIKAKSLISLLAGIALGLPLVISSFLPSGQRTALIASSVAAGFFGSRYAQTGQLFPSGYGAVASVLVALLNCTILPSTTPVKQD